MSTNLSRFPVSSDDLIESMAASVISQKRGSLGSDPLPRKPPLPYSNPTTQPGSARNTPPPHKVNLGSSSAISFNLSPNGSKTGSTRASLNALDTGDSRRSSVSRIATDAVKDLRKGVKNVTDTTKKATFKVKDKTADVGAQVKGATKGASKWVAATTSKTAKAAMEQAKGGLSVGEKFTLFASEKISVLSRKGFTHVFMFLILIGYTAFGALLFMMCEAPTENSIKILVNEKRAELAEGLWNQKSSDYETFSNEVTRLLKPYNEELQKAYSAGMSTDSDEKEWTFWKSMFYCSTITTTIGYGHMTPKTTAGRALTIIYAIIGIPIFLILMADFGKLFTRLLKHVFIFITRVYRSGTCVRAREHPTIQVLQRRASGSFGSLKKRFFWRKTQSDDVQNPEEPPTPETPNREKEGSGFVVGSMGSHGIDIEQYFEDDNFNIPVSLALFILILYMIFGCVLYITWENWTFFEAFYFIFISMTTIGFGDFVPEHPAFMMATTAYLVFGLALTAMCINIIQEKLSNTFRKASLKLKASFSKIMESHNSQVDGEEKPVSTGPIILESTEDDQPAV